MIRFWGRLSSINVRKVVLAAQWMGLPFERRDAGAAFGVVNSPDYRRHNPNGLVPLLDDEGYFLWESNVIVRYLAARYGGPRWYPQDLRMRFDQERWMDWQQTTLNPAGRGAFVQLIRTPAPLRQDALVSSSVAATEPLWDLLDAALAERPFVSGAAPGLADLPLACERHRWCGLASQSVPPRPRPHLDRWYAALRALPASGGILDLPLA